MLVQVYSTYVYVQVHIEVRVKIPTLMSIDEH